MMKLTVNIARYLTGLLFVFSGLVKAIDPRGLAYKMQEFFEAWANAGFMKSTMEILHHQALVFSVIMITLEVAVGVALILGWQKKITSWCLFALVLFFTFLTSYVLFSGKIRACGCFGDCIPLTPVQTFSKDIVLLFLSVIFLFNQKYLVPLAKPFTLLVLVLIATFATLFLQWYVMNHLPVKDCLPYKKGNNILELRKMPSNAIPDKFSISFIYQKNGSKKEFSADALPDSSWEYVDRLQKLVEAGENNIPLINDFTLITANGNDTTEAILNQQNNYYLLFIKDIKTLPNNFIEDKTLSLAAAQKHIPIYIVTGAREKILERFGDLFIKDVKVDIPIFSCDGTALKTAARADMVLYKMNGPVIENKWGWADFDKVIF